MFNFSGEYIARLGTNSASKVSSQGRFFILTSSLISILALLYAHSGCIISLNNRSTTTKAKAAWTNSFCEKVLRRGNSIKRTKTNNNNLWLTQCVDKFYFHHCVLKTMIWADFRLKNPWPDNNSYLIVTFFS